MLRDIDKIMLRDIDLTPEQWEKVNHFFSHNMGNALSVLDMIIGDDPLDVELFRRESAAALARFRSMRDLMTEQAEETGREHGTKKTETDEGKVATEAGQKVATGCQS